MATTVDPTDLSPLYFADDASTQGKDLTSGEHPHDLAPDHCYCHPALQVSASGTVQGRGLTVLHDIPAGECLFVVPPVARADVDKVLRRYHHRHDDEDPNRLVGRPSSSLEGTAEQVLLEAMRVELMAKGPRAWSILTLVGSLDDGIDKIPSCMVHRTPSLDLLTAQDAAAECTEPLFPDADLVSDEHLLHIIRRNAFGPDFVSYERLEHHPNVRPFRLLGIYPLAAMINHSCVSNAVRVYAGETMVVHTSQPIAAGTEVLWSYVSPIDPMRQEVLQRQHGFTCTCDQCRAMERISLSEHLHLDASLESLASKYNRRLLSLDSLSKAERCEVRQLVAALEDGLSTRSYPSGLSNPDKRYLRLGFMHLYLHYLNLNIGGGSDGDNDNEGSDPSPPAHLTLITQLHLAFCASHNASTEHLSVRHAPCGSVLGHCGAVAIDLSSLFFLSHTDLALGLRTSRDAAL